MWWAIAGVLWGVLIAGVLWYWVNTGWIRKGEEEEEIPQSVLDAIKELEDDGVL